MWDNGLSLPFPCMKVFFFLILLNIIGLLKENKKKVSLFFLLFWGNNSFQHFQNPLLLKKISKK